MADKKQNQKQSGGQQSSGQQVYVVGGVVYTNAKAAQQAKDAQQTRR